MQTLGIRTVAECHLKGPGDVPHLINDIIGMVRHQRQHFLLVLVCLRWIGCDIQYPCTMVCVLKCQSGGQCAHMSQSPHQFGWFLWSQTSWSARRGLRRADFTSSRELHARPNQERDRVNDPTSLQPKREPTSCKSSIPRVAAAVLNPCLFLRRPRLKGAAEALAQRVDCPVKNNYGFQLTQLVPGLNINEKKIENFTCRCHSCNPQSTHPLSSRMKEKKPAGIYSFLANRHNRMADPHIHITPHGPIPA